MISDIYINNSVPIMNNRDIIRPNNISNENQINLKNEEDIKSIYPKNTIRKNNQLMTNDQMRNNHPMRANNNHMPNYNQNFMYRRNPYPYIPSIYSFPYGKPNFHPYPFGTNGLNIQHKNQKNPVIKQNNNERQNYNLLNEFGPNKGKNQRKQKRNKAKKDPKFINRKDLTSENDGQHRRTKQKPKPSIDLEKRNPPKNPIYGYGKMNGNKPYETIDGIDIGMLNANEDKSNELGDFYKLFHLFIFLKYLKIFYIIILLKNCNKQ